MKTLNRESSLGAYTARSILDNSFRCQQMLKSRKVLSAREKHIEDGNLYIEYPFLDDGIWQPITPVKFWAHFPATLLQMCLVIDYLHTLDLVHCDLKLSNFMINLQDKEPTIILVDLDFLVRTGSSLQAKVLGTPDHIAPEIFANELVTPQVDVFSMGKTLEKCVESGQSLPGSPASQAMLSKVKMLAEDLTRREALLRPRVLLDALARREIIDMAALQAANKTLLTMLLLARLRESRAGKGRKRKSLKKTFLEQNKVLGLGEELTSELARVAQIDSPKAYRVMRDLVRDATLERYGDYWHFMLGDEQLQSAYAALEDSAPPAVDRETVEPLEHCLARVASYRKAECYQKAFLCLKGFAEDEDRLTALRVPSRISLLQELGDLAVILNRSRDAALYYDTALELSGSPEQTDLKLVYERATLAHTLGQIDRAMELARQGATEAGRRGDRAGELSFRRLEAWALGSQGKYREAERLLDSIRDTAVDLNLDELIIRILYTYGILEWKRGDFRQAEKRLLASFEKAAGCDLLGKSISTIFSLCLLYLELADYRKSVKYGKLAIQNLQEARDRSKLPLIFANLSNSYTRLAEYAKAEYWLQRSLTSESQAHKRNNLIVYFLSNGFLKSNEGDLQSARRILFKALESLFPGVPEKVTGKVYHNLAEIALYQGQSVSCEEYLKAAAEKFRACDDKSSLAELEFIGTLNSLYQGRPQEIQILLPQLGTLIDYGCRYYASLCLFHILVNAGPKDSARALGVAESLQPLFERGEAPLFEAVHGLARIVRRPAEKLENIGILKSAYRILDKSGAMFLATIVCRRVAERYREDAKEKLAKKFLLQAEKLAKTLKNEAMERSLSEQVASLADHGGKQTRMIDLIFRISEVFKNIRDYDKSLTRVVEFAVDQTGAERGVLLLKNQQSSELRVRAFVNCDEDSLRDVADFSSTIPQEVVKDPRPVVIDNALTNARTKGYKSIVVHNILSVICTPIVFDGKLLGILYLDHHTIPALFDRDDVTYISSTANFIAVMLTTIQEYRDISLVNRQLIEDATDLGDNLSFITNDSSMRELLSKLPEIARTNTPILIMGESGTGKEILCQMIHNLSLRSKKPLIKLNCSAIAEGLIESELFGVAQNVATGVAERDGKFSAADGGTLFLDEIGDMPLHVQSKVLRVLDLQEFEKVGSNKTIYSDTRFIYATNKDLHRLIREEKFREDLYYRINTIIIEVPPLRERRDDIPLLIEHFISIYASPSGNAPVFTPEVQKALVFYSWPGNVRELKNFVERCCILYPGERINVSGLPAEFQQAGRDNPQSKQAGETYEKQTIRDALIKQNWVQLRAARSLNMPLSTLRRKIKRYNISRDM